MKKDDARSRAGLGAARMDAVKPGWFNAIDKERLDCRSSFGCVVAQAFKGSFYVYRAIVLEGTVLESFAGREKSINLGFILKEDEQDTADALALKAAWIEEIDTRRRQIIRAVP